MFRIFWILSFTLFLVSPSNSQNIINPSFEQWGFDNFCDINTTPDGWTNYSTAGQAFEEGNSLICPTTIPASPPVGDTYARAYAEDSSTGEGAFQNIDGFVVGNTYQISFIYAGSNLFPGTNDVQWHVFIEDVEIGQTPEFSSNEPSWNAFNIEFVPASPTVKVGFRLFTVDNNSSGSGGIDDVQISAVTVVEPEPPVASFHVSNPIICAGTCVQFFNESEFADAVQWDFPGGSPESSASSNSVLVCYDNPGTYPVELTAFNDQGASTFSLDEAIIVVDLPLADLTLVGDSLVLQNIEATDQVEWAFNSTSIEVPSNVLFPVQSGIYTVTLSNFAGCETVLQVPVDVGSSDDDGSSDDEVDSSNDDFDPSNQVQFWAPNAVTFDSNNLNDVWIPEGNKEAWARYELQIYNRWGELIFQTTNPYEGWIGNSFQSDFYAPDGVYTYFAKVLLQNKPHHGQYVGHITLLR